MTYAYIMLALAAASAIAGAYVAWRIVRTGAQYDADE